MKTSIIYYVVDPIMESVVGSFSAPSEDAAKVVFKKSVLENDKMKSYGNSLKCFVEPITMQICESYSEIVDSCGEVNLYDTAN